MDTPEVNSTVDEPAFDREAFIAALRADQVGKSKFPKFLAA